MKAIQERTDHCLEHSPEVPVVGLSGTPANRYKMQRHLLLSSSVADLPETEDL